MLDSKNIGRAVRARHQKYRRGAQGIVDLGYVRASVKQGRCGPCQLRNSGACEGKVGDYEQEIRFLCT